MEELKKESATKLWTRRLVGLALLVLIVLLHNRAFVVVGYKLAQMYGTWSYACMAMVNRTVPWLVVPGFGWIFIAAAALAMFVKKLPARILLPIATGLVLLTGIILTGLAILFAGHVAQYFGIPIKIISQIPGMVICRLIGDTGFAVAAMVWLIATAKGRMPLWLQPLLLIVVPVLVLGTMFAITYVFRLPLSDYSYAKLASGMPVLLCGGMCLAINKKKAYK